MRSFFARSHEQSAVDIRRGGTPSVERAGLPYTLASHYGYDSLAEHLRIDQDLQARFTDYEEMDEYPEISVALDIYADDSCTPNLDREEAIWVTSKDQATADALNEMLHKHLTIEDDIWGSARTLCISEGQRVWTSKGPIPIEDVKPGDWVQGYRDGEAKLLRVKRVFDNGVREVYRLQTKHRELIATKDHPVLVRDNDGRDRWTPIEDLVLRRFPSGDIDQKNSSRILISTAAPEPPEVPSWDELFVQDVPDRPWRQKGSPLELKLPVKIESWVCRLLGFLWGDGFMGTEDLFSDSTGIFFSRGEDEEQNEFYDELLERIGLVPTLNEKLQRTEVSSIRFKELLIRLGWKNGASRKRLPMWIGSVPREYREAFLQGFMDADGWTSHPKTWKRTAFHFEIANVELARDLKNIVDGLGYRSGKVRVRHRKPGFKINGKVVQETQPTGMLTYSHFKYEPGFRAETVNKIEKWGVARVFDLEIDDEAHNFIVEGLPVHNCKYGNNYGELLVSDEGVIGINYLPPPTMRRVEDTKGNLLGFLQDIRGEFNITMEDFYALAQERGGAGQAPQPSQASRNRAPGELMVFEDWEVVHWRLRGKHLRSVYGHAVIEPARWVWKRLALLEDALLIYKLERAPSRYAFYIDVGQLDAERGLAHVNRVKNQFTRKKFVNPQTGKLDMRYNPLCLHGDTEVQLLDGSVRTIEDMAEAHGRGEEQWVWSVDLDDEGRLRPGKVEWAGKTRRDAKLVKVTLDSGESVTVTPDHKMIRRDGTKVQAQELVAGDSLMPFRRRISSKAKGEQLEGYELVYCPKTRRSLYGHRVVAEDQGLRESGQLVHHEDFNPLNNAPWNLMGMSYRDHLNLHRQLGFNGGEVIKQLRIEDQELDRRLREASRRNMTRYNQSAERREKLAEWNRDRDQGRFIRGYNDSEQHTRDNKVRSEAMRELWANPERREKAARNMRVKFPLAFVEGVKELVRQNPNASMDDIARAASDVLWDILQGANTRKIVSIHRHMLRRMATEEGHGDFDSFRRAAIGDNHKVVSVEWLEERADTFTLTVGETHTFAVNAGVFVCNSHDEDFFIPVRDGKRTTEVDVIQGPDYTETDSLEYHRDKLVASVKVPKMYYGYGGEAVERQLSTQDIRFARAVMRIQRCLRGGYRKACRVHLIATGADPDKHDYQVHMTVPSSILELARMEVLNTTADLASRMGEIVSTKWILIHLFKFTEEEAVKVMEENNEEKLKDGAIEAQVQKLQMQSVDDETASGGAPMLTETQQMEMRLSKLIKAVRRDDWRREFESGNRAAEKRAEVKLDRLLRENTVVNKRVRELGGLLVDLRKTMRAEASP